MLATAAARDHGLAGERIHAVNASHAPARRPFIISSVSAAAWASSTGRTAHSMPPSTLALRSRMSASAASRDCSTQSMSPSTLWARALASATERVTFSRSMME
ncbi:MAG TPA: hypothetical protein VNI01_03805 [Elusimicrobiota bacterium]|nr:hypothetical protein [Elusimicrobiota bacterium]